MPRHLPGGRRHAVAAAVLLGVLAALLLVAPEFAAPRSVDGLRVRAYGSSVVFFGVLCAATAALVAARSRPTRWLVAAVVVSFATVVALTALDVDVASDVAKVVFGALAGAGLSRAVERPVWLVPICVLVPLADAWSVFSSRGVTHAVVERAQRDRSWIDWPTVATPIAGLPYEQFARIGIVDVLFTGVFLAAASRWQLGIVRCTALLALAFVGTNVLVFEGVATAVPALPLLCLAFLVGASPGLWNDARAARGH